MYGREEMLEEIRESDGHDLLVTVTRKLEHIRLAPGWSKEFEIALKLKIVCLVGNLVEDAKHDDGPPF